MRSDCGHFQFNMQFWRLDWINNCLRYQSAIANHKDYHFIFHNWSQDANKKHSKTKWRLSFSSSEHKDHPDCVKCWTYNGLTWFGHIVHSHRNTCLLIHFFNHIPLKDWYLYKGLEVAIQDPHTLCSKGQQLWSTYSRRRQFHVSL